MVLIETDRRPGQGVAVPRRRDGNVLVPGGLRQPGIVAPPMGDFPIARPKDTPTREFHSRSRTEFLQAGGTFRMLDLSAEAQDEGLPTEDWEAVRRVRDIYTDDSVIEHLADVIPDYSVEEMLAYYRKKPDARLLVAEMPGEGVVGAVTLAPEEGLRRAKLNRLVVDPEHNREHAHTAHWLVRAGLWRLFSAKDETGRYRYNHVTIGVIQGVPGCEIAERVFKNIGFEPTVFFKKTCDGWDSRRGRLVERSAQQMIINRWNYQNWRRDAVKLFGSQTPSDTAESSVVYQAAVS